MITKEQAVEIVQKFSFFQGQRAGRELWLTKPKEVQEVDLVDFSADCRDLLEYLESADEPRYKASGIPERFWILFDVPGFYNIVEYTTSRVLYKQGKLDKIWGSTGKQEAVAYCLDFDKTVFFSKEEAEAALNKLFES